MKKTRIFCSACLIALVIGCKSEKKEVPTETEAPMEREAPLLSTEEKKGQDLLEKCLIAHGGLEQWRSFEGLEYQLNDKGKMVYQITHLRDRRAYLKSKKYEVGFNGKVAWSLPNAEQVSGGSAAFYYNLDFYFIGVPFLLKDPGVVVHYAGKVVVNGQDYESLKVTFGSGVGLTPEDVYYLYLDPKTYMLQILTYSISYFDRENAGVNSAKVYSDYVDVQGLKMPTKMENFEWKDGSMGKSKDHLRLFKDIRFLTKITDESVFEVRPGAVEEKI